MWMKLAAEGVALALALATTWLNNNGVKITTKELGENAQKFIDLNQKDLSTAEGRDDDAWERG